MPGNSSGGICAAGIALLPNGQSYYCYPGSNPGEGTFYLTGISNVCIFWLSYLTWIRGLKRKEV